MEEFTTEKLIRKIGKSEGLAIVAICIGVVMLFLERWTAIHSFRDVFKVLDSFFPLGIGIGLLISNANRIKKLRGSYVKISDRTVEFKSRGLEFQFDNPKTLRNTEIKLDQIIFTESNEKSGILYLDDYIGEGEQRKIKELIAVVKENMNTHNSK
jgi:hypothetical protein